jgi:hypothetical protein
MGNCFKPWCGLDGHVCPDCAALRREEVAPEKVDEETDEGPGGCGYLGYEFGAGTYPDSICVEGRLFDADDCDDKGNLYEPGENIPCPMCDPKGAINYWTGRNQRGGGTREAARKAARELVLDIRLRRGVAGMAQTSEG